MAKVKAKEKAKEKDGRPALVHSIASSFQVLGRQSSNIPLLYIKDEDAAHLT